MSIDAFRSHLLPLVEAGAVPGVLAVRSSSDGREVFTAPGPGGTRIDLDSLVRIASLTKPIAAAATLALAEQGRLALGDSVERFLPELATRHVLRSVRGMLDDVEPARQPITIRHLLTC